MQFLHGTRSSLLPRAPQSVGPALVIDLNEQTARRIETQVPKTRKTTLYKCQKLEKGLDEQQR